MRLIDADLLYRCETCKHYTAKGSCTSDCDSFESYSPNWYKLPKIDPESLRPQGEWISRFPRHWKGKDECSRCGYHEKDHRDLSHYNYCPNCGSKMIKNGDT